MRRLLTRVPAGWCRTRRGNYRREDGDLLLVVFRRGYDWAWLVKDWNNPEIETAFSPDNFSTPEEAMADAEEWI